jgi:hypothetical protein
MLAIKEAANCVGLVRGSDYAPAAFGVLVSHCHGLISPSRGLKPTTFAFVSWTIWSILMAS